MATVQTGIATEFIQFTRASNATVTDSDGKVKWAPHNLLLASESFDAASWAKSSVTPTANSIAAPNGTTTADTLAASGANGTTLQTFTAEAISYTFAVWLKRKTGTGNIQIAADSGTYTTVTITSDWALYTVTQTPAAGSKSAGIRIVTSADEVYAWGAALYRSDLAMQLNTSAYPMYNPTTPKNLLGYTESLTTGWTNFNTTDAIVSEVNPVGLTGAVDVAATAGNGTLLGSVSLLASPYTFSIWLKRKTGSGTVEITVDGGTTYVAAAVTGTWTRFSTTLTSLAGNRSPGIRLVTSGDAVYAWGAQLSESASLDAYAPVYGAAVTSAAYYGPRRDFDPVTLACKGLLVEEQRANLITYSSEFDNVAWTKDRGTITSTTETSPSNTATADVLTQTAGQTTSALVYINGTVASAPASTAYTFSVYAKKGGKNFLTIGTDATAAAGVNSYSYFNISNGTPGTAASGHTISITNAGNGWYRCTLTATTRASIQGMTFYFGHADTDNSLTVTDSGSTSIWGAQLDSVSGGNASFATSYIPTGAATATRNADVASVSTQAFPYSASTGSLVVNYNYIGSSTLPYPIALDIGSAVTFFGVSHAANLLNSDQGSVSISPVLNATGLNKVASAYAANDRAVSANSNSANTSASSYTPGTATTLSIGSLANSASYRMNGHIRQITYLPRRISNTELQTRTA